MRKIFVILLLLIVVIGGLGLAMKRNAPKPPKPSAKERWAQSGVPIETAVINTGDMEQTVEVTGNITALDKVTLSSKVAGRLAAMYVREGDRVRAGQVVAMLDQDDARHSLDSAQEGLRSAIARLAQAKTTRNVTKIQTDSAIEQAQAALRSAEAKLTVVKNPARSQDRMVAENRVAAAKAGLDNKEADFRRNKQLLEKGAISQATFDLAQTQYVIAQTDLKSAQDQLDLIKEGGRSEDVTSAQAAVDTARQGLRAAKANAAQNLLREDDVRSAQAAVGQAGATVALAQQQLSYTSIKSPISGQVSSRMADAGQVVSPGQALADVVNMGSVYLKGDVSEKKVVNVNPGQPVRVRVDAIGDRVFNGTVAEVFPSGSEQSRNFMVRIAINDKSPAIKPGMFARGDVVTGIHRNVILVPKDAIEQSSGASKVFVIVDDKEAFKAVRCDVVALAENTDYVEIASPNSLKAGDVVATAGRQNLSDGVKVSPKK